MNAKKPAPKTISPRLHQETLHKLEMARSEIFSLRTALTDAAGEAIREELLARVNAFVCDELLQAEARAMKAAQESTNRCKLMGLPTPSSARVMMESAELFHRLLETVAGTEIRKVG